MTVHRLESTCKLTLLSEFTADIATLSSNNIFGIVTCRSWDNKGDITYQHVSSRGTDSCSLTEITKFP